MTDCGDLNCKEALRLLDQYLDRSLDTAAIETLEHHLNRCHPCADEYGFERTLLDQMRARLQQVDIPDGLRRRVLTALDHLADPPGAD